MPRTKRISFRLPIDMWEKLYRLYPEHGARTVLMKMLVAKLIEFGPEFNEKLKEGLLECIPEEGEE